MLFIFPDYLMYQGTKFIVCALVSTANLSPISEIIPEHKLGVVRCSGRGHPKDIHAM